MKTCATLLLLSITSLVSLSHADVKKERELQDILRKHADAMGGLRNWNKVESIRTSGTIERNGQLVDFCIIKKRPNQIRATITMPIPGKKDEMLQIIRAHDGREAWTSTRLAGGETLSQQTLSGDDADQLVDEAQVLPKLIHLWQHNAKLELNGIKSLDGVPHHIISASPKSSSAKHYSFLVSSETYMVSEIKAFKSNQLITQTIASNITETSGIALATTLHLESPTTGNTIMLIDDITVGVGIYEEYFEGSADGLQLSSNHN